jgi:hypothetical protein
LKFYPSVKAAGDDLSKEFGGFFSRAKNIFFGAVSKIIKGAASLGKTWLFCSEAKEHPELQGAYYTPSHALAVEVEQEFKKEGVDAKAIRGRRLLCQKYEVAEQIAKLGGHGNVEKLLCCDGDNKCANYDECPYLAQFNSQPDVVILQHALLPLFVSKREKQLYRNGERPDYICIDESFVNQFAAESYVDRDAFYNCKEIPLPLRELILDALDWNRPLLKRLRDAGYRGGDLLKVAEKLPSHCPSLKDISPEQSLETQLKILGKKKLGPYLKKPLQLIASELETTQHDFCQRVHLVSSAESEQKSRIYSHWIKPFTRNKIGKQLDPQPGMTRFIPTLVIDASAQPSLIKKVLGEFSEVPTVEINARRNAHVTQLISSQVSTTSLRKNDSYIDDVAKIAKGCTLVEVEEGQASITFMPVDVLRWEICQLDISDLTQADEVVDKAHEAVTESLKYAEGKPLALRFIIEGASPVHKNLYSHSERWTNEIRAAATDAGLGNVWVEKISLKTQAPRAKTLQDEGPLGELKRFLRTLPQDSDALQALCAEFHTLINRLPAEARQSERGGGIDPSNPDTICRLLNGVEELLMARLLAH